MAKSINSKNESTLNGKENKKSTKKAGVSTSINAAAILDILERYSGHMQNGEIVKLRLETPAKSLDRSLGIRELLKSQYGISLKTDTIKSNLTELVALIDKVKCTEKEEDDPENDNAYKVEHYWIEKTNILDSGEYKILKSKIEADSSLNPSEKASLIRKIDSISSSDYSKELGTLDNTPIFDKASLGDANVSKKLDMIGKAIRTEVKIAFFNNIFDVNKKLCKVGDEIVFSPYQITDSKGYIYVIGLKDGDQNASHYRIDKLSDLRILKTTFDGRDKNKNLNRYKESHPFMSNSQSAIKATLKLKGNITDGQDNIGAVIDTFGYSPVFREIKDNNINEYCIVELNATAEAIYKFTLMNSDIVEVVAPESLRNRLRKMSKYSYDSYLSTYEDFYEAEIDKIKEGGLGYTIKREFHCEGVDLSKRTEHHNIPIIRLCLDNNNVEDISFVRNYKDLCSFRTRKNPIVDYTPLCDIDTIQAMQIMDSKLESYDFIKNCKSLRKLTLDNNDVKDKSALYTPLHLDYLVLFDEDEIDVPLFKENNPLTEVLIGWDKVDDKKYFINPTQALDSSYTKTYKYPVNIIDMYYLVDSIKDKDKLGEINDKIVSNKEIIAVFDEMIESLGGIEAKIAFSIFKDGESVRSCAKKYNVRMQDVLEARGAMFKILFSKENRAKIRKIIINEYPGVNKNRLRSLENKYLTIETNTFRSAYVTSKDNLKNRRKRYD